MIGPSQQLQLKPPHASALESRRLNRKFILSVRPQFDKPAIVRKSELNPRKWHCETHYFRRSSYCAYCSSINPMECLHPPAPLHAPTRLEWPTASSRVDRPFSKTK